MVEFLKNHLMDIIEISISLIVGFLGGNICNIYISKKIKQNSKINGDNNNVTQKGE